MKSLTLFLLYSLGCAMTLLASPPDGISSTVAMAEQHKKELNYEKAHSLYQLLAADSPDNIEFLVACAELEVLMGKENTAIRTYEDVLKKSPDNLAANIFLGNYHFLKAEERRMKLDNEYEKSTLPTRQKNENYKKNLRLVYVTDYLIAHKYLNKVIRLFPSVEAKRTIEKIDKIGVFVREK
ncbi:hypothetical protein LJC72_09855 [Bacteroides sp. OttesenSCG-928-D19]|nr:hypothetical protein [Bacteroides sp. OttesenSCG-928-D19]